MMRPRPPLHQLVPPLLAFRGALLDEIQGQDESLSKAPADQRPAAHFKGMSDDKLLNELRAAAVEQGVKEISILSNEKQVVAVVEPVEDRQDARIGPRLPRHGDSVIITGTLAVTTIPSSRGGTVTLDIPIIVDNEKRATSACNLLTGRFPTDHP